MSERRRFAVIFAGALLALSCKSAKGNGELPPPTGSGTPPPDIPALASAQGPDQAGDPQDNGSGHFSGTGTLVAAHQAELGPKQRSYVCLEKRDGSYSRA